MSDIKQAAVKLAEFVRLGKKATPGPWACPGANVFRLFAWKDCGEDGMRPRRCIVHDSMADAYFGAYHVAWPQNEAASMEAYANLQMIASARSAPDALVAVLRETEWLCAQVVDAYATTKTEDRAERILAAIRPIIEAAKQEHDPDQD